MIALRKTAKSRHMSYGAIRTRPARRAAPKLSRAGAAVFSALAGKTRFADPQLAAHWPSIAGAEIASLCRPGRIVGARAGRTLEIVVQSGAAAAEAQMRADNIIARVNGYLGPNSVTRIAVRQIAGAHSAPAPLTQPRGAQEEDGSPLGQALSSFRAAVKRRNGEAD